MMGDDGERQTIEVQLVPVADEDRECLDDALGYLRAFQRLLDRDDWPGIETIYGLLRIRERIGYAGGRYAIPVPESFGSLYLERGTPLFVNKDAGQVE